MGSFLIQSGILLSRVAGWAAGRARRGAAVRNAWSVVAPTLIAAIGCHHGDVQAAAPVGVWKVRGSDTVGGFVRHYTGRVELRNVGSSLYFTRVIDYANFTVEDDRTLSWVWQGSAVWNEETRHLDIAVPLQQADFVRSRGALVRTPDDMQPLPVRGSFAVANAGFAGRFTAPDLSAEETWFAGTALGRKPIFSESIAERPLDPPLDGSIKAVLFRRFASYHALPEVQPYTGNAEFREAVHTIIEDRTDFDFYQKNPNALRVVGKVLDPISLQETLARADAYRWKLAEKAAYFDDEVAASFLDPVTGMIGEARYGGQLLPSHNGALWTGTYVASQVDRYRLTRSAAALDNVIKGVQGLMTLVEITDDPRAFARTLRAATGNPTGPWHAGSGSLAHLEWEEGGNNDMFKGVVYGMLSAYTVLCDRARGHAALCDRIRRNARHIADDLEIAQPSSQNRLAAQWLAAYVTRQTDFFVNATSEWAVQSPVLAQGNATLLYSNGIADWSGTHLGLVGYAIFKTLGQKYPLPGANAAKVVASGVDVVYGHFAGLRMGLWDVAFAALGTVRRAEAADEARWRLREIPAPKTELDVDHRINAAFVMSPYPSAPWKNDWTQNDRTQSLRGYPLFEGIAQQACTWTAVPFTYRNDTTGRQFPGTDYLHAYWLGRQMGVFSARD